MKVVVVYASSGAGHQKAAEAIFKVLKDSPGIHARLIDSLDYTTPLFRFLYPRIYLSLVRYLPMLWGFFYDGLNAVLIGHFLRTLRRMLNGMNGRALEKFFLTENPDVIVSTHFFGSEVASALKRRQKLQARLLTVVTDYVIHSVWVNPKVDHYVVGAADTQEALMDRGVPEDKIAVLGIPIDPVFEEEQDRVSVSKKIGVDPGKFTVLVASGGFGVGPIAHLVSRLSRNECLQLLVVCGHNRSLYRRLTSRTASLRQRVHLYGFVDNIHELMSVSDCMVSKSGGLTMSEALAKRLPTFILSPIPGQEMGNRDVLIRHGVAFSANTIRELERRFWGLNELQKVLAGVRRRIGAFSPHQTARRVAEFIVSEGKKDE